MRLITALTKKEILERIRSIDFLLSFGLILILSTVSIYNKLITYKAEVASYDSNIRSQLMELSQSESFFDLAKSPVSFFRKPQPLQILATGVNRELSGVYYRIFMIREKANYKSAFMGGSLANYLPSVDFVFTVGILFSLFAFMASYDALNKEDQNGTLKLILANSLSKSHIILGKMLGHLVVFSTAIGLCFLLMFLLIGLDNHIRFTLKEYGAIALVFIATLLYVGNCLLIGIFSSIVIRRATTALFMLLFVWTALYVYFPCIISAYAAGSSSAASREVKEQMIKLQDKLSDAWLKKVDPAYRSYKQNNNRTGYIAVINASDVQYIQGNRKIAQDYFISKVLKQEQILCKMSVFSPAALFSNLVHGLTGTSVESEAKNYVQLLDFISNQYAPYLFEKQIEESNYPKRSNHRLDLTGMPRFVPVSDSIGVRLIKVIPELGILVAYNLLFFLLCYFVFIRRAVI